MVKIISMTLLQPLREAYLRNNRSTGQKSLRCFPRCCDRGHIRSGFCGSKLEVTITIDKEKGVLKWDEVMFIAQIRPSKEAGISSLRTVPKARILSEMRDTRSPRMGAELLPGRIEVLEEKVDTVTVKVTLNAERHSWDYSWKSNRWSGFQSTHVVDLILIDDIEVGRNDLRVLASQTTVPFLIISSHKTPKMASKVAEGAEGLLSLSGGCSGKNESEPFPTDQFDEDLSGPIELLEQAHQQQGHQSQPRRAAGSANIFHLVLQDDLSNAAASASTNLHHPHQLQQQHQMPVKSGNISNMADTLTAGATVNGKKRITPKPSATLPVVGLVEAACFLYEIKQSGQGQLASKRSSKRAKTCHHEATDTTVDRAVDPQCSQAVPVNTRAADVLATKNDCLPVVPPPGATGTTVSTTSSSSLSSIVTDSADNDDDDNDDNDEDDDDDDTGDGHNEDEDEEGEEEYTTECDTASEQGRYQERHSNSKEPSSHIHQAVSQGFRQGQRQGHDQRCSERGHGKGQGQGQGIVQSQGQAPRSIGGGQGQSIVRTGTKSRPLQHRGDVIQLPRR